MDQTKKVSIFNLWWVLLSFVIFVNWLALLLAGLTAKHKQWTIWGIVYFVPVVLLFIFANNEAVFSKGTLFYNMTMSLFFISWLASIIHSFVIAREYRHRLAAVRYSFQGRMQKTYAPPAPSEHESKLNTIIALKQKVEKLIEDSNLDDSIILSDIKPTLDTFLSQTKELVESDKQLKELLKQFSEKRTQNKIKELKQKIAKTENHKLKTEYENALKKHQSLFEDYKAFGEKREMVRLRLESIEMSLKQIKFDLIKMQGMISEEKRKEITGAVEEKSQDLSQYISILQDSYRNTDMNFLVDQ